MIQNYISNAHFYIEPKKIQPYFNGYDYRTIGGIADKVILMAHDYEAYQTQD